MANYLYDTFEYNNGITTYIRPDDSWDYAWRLFNEDAKTIIPGKYDIETIYHSPKKRTTVVSFARADVRRVVDEKGKCNQRLEKKIKVKKGC